MAEITGDEPPEGIAALIRESRTLLVTRRALARILRRHLSAALTLAQITEIADLLEAREAVDYEVGSEMLIADVLFELASPELHEELTAIHCADIIGRLELPAPPVPESE